MKIWTIFGAFIAALNIVSYTQILMAEEETERWNQTKEYMREISRQIGVTCAHCHDNKNYKDTSKKPYKISLDHIEIVKVLNNQFKGKIAEKVDCYLCHRGVAKPDYKEKPALF